MSTYEIMVTALPQKRHALPGQATAPGSEWVMPSLHWDNGSHPLRFNSPPVPDLPADKTQASPIDRRYVASTPVDSRPVKRLPHPAPTTGTHATN
ncbi:MAG: hypothetical protein GY926_15215 [bacterium]|nr:hypothetical protein [bacterium]MCP4966564.1 hypothetical protein [bacterium]